MANSTSSRNAKFLIGGNFVIFGLNLMEKQLNLPKVIFFDAVGTLFGVQGSVGKIYSQIANKHGVEVDPKILHQSFGKHFSQATPLVVQTSEPDLLKQQEYRWWQQIVRSTFLTVESLDKFTDFECFFEELYNYFATKNPWFIYEETNSCLQKWQQKNVELGIISNFDTRLYSVLEVLKIKSYFSSITISSESKAAKPNSLIFESALAKHNCSPAQAWHVGDSFQEDYQGSGQIGITPFLLTRDKNMRQVKNELPNLNSLG